MLVFKAELEAVKKQARNLKSKDAFEFRKTLAGEGIITEDTPRKYGLKFPLDSVGAVRHFAKVLKLPAREIPSNESDQVEMVAPKDELVSQC